MEGLDYFVLAARVLARTEKEKTGLLRHVCSLANIPRKDGGEMEGGDELLRLCRARSRDGGGDGSLSVFEGALDVALGVAFGDGGAFVVLFFAEGYGDFDFDFAFFEIDFGGNEGGAVGFAFADKGRDFFFVEKEFARSGRVVVLEVAGVDVGRNVGIGEVEFRSFGGDEAVFDADVSGFDRAHFVAAQNHPRLIKGAEKVVERGSFVDRLDFHGCTVPFFLRIFKDFLHFYGASPYKDGRDWIASSLLRASSQGRKKKRLDCFVMFARSLANIPRKDGGRGL